MNLRRLRTLLVREARATWRDAFTMTILVSVPLAALLVFSSILSTEVKDLALGVHDACGTASSRRLVAELSARGTFSARPFATRDALDRALVDGSLSVALVIPPDFDRHLRAWRTREAAAQVEVIYDGAEAVLAANAEGFLRGLVTAAVADLAGGADARDGERAGGPRGVAVVTRALYNPELDGTRYMVAGVFGFVLSFLTTLITAVSIVNERITGTFEQLQVTPATSLEILLGKILPLGAVFAADVVLMMVAAGLLLGVWPEGNPLFFVGVSAFYVLTSLALGLIISATSATTAEAVQKTVLFSIPLVQLSGFAFPTRNMPTVVRWLAEVFPATHYIRVSRGIYLRGEGPLSLAPELCLLVAFAGVLIALALRTIGART
ncbi:MAG TPA: ABC transporter permease [Myxococcota bacterium]|nr:ABC transporter permease [Myxococcota bacterium]